MVSGLVWRAVWIMACEKIIRLCVWLKWFTIDTSVIKTQFDAINDTKLLSGCHYDLHRREFLSSLLFFFFFYFYFESLSTLSLHPFHVFQSDSDDERKKREKNERNHQQHQQQQIESTTSAHLSSHHNTRAAEQKRMCISAHCHNILMQPYKPRANFYKMNIHKNRRILTVFHACV